MKRITFLWAFVLTCMAGTAQTGSLIPSFGNGGGAITPIGPGTDEARNLIVQPDGKIVVVGHAYNGLDYDFAVVRYHTNGTPDSSFGTAGIVITDIGGGDDLAYGVGIQADGKIVVAGDGALTSYDFTVVRYLANGVLDSSFAGDGIATVDITGFQSDDHINYLLIQPDGKIVANGYRNAGSNGDFAMIRLNMDGSPDTGFGGGDGIVFTDLNGGSEDFSSGVLLQPDGKLILAGSSGGGSAYDFAAVRYHADGTLDTSFNSLGGVIYSIGGDDHCYASALQADGKIVLVGWADMSGEDDFGTIRLLPNGGLDTSFGGDGIVTTNIGPGPTDDQAIGVAIQSNGCILLCGNSWNGDFNLVRYDTSGNLDSNFHFDGLASGDVSPEQNDFARKVRLDGAVIYVAGWSAQGGNRDFSLAAFENDNGAFRVSFAGRGVKPGKSPGEVTTRKADAMMAGMGDAGFAGKGWRVYPNPASDQLQVQLPAGKTGKLVLQVLDAAGKVVRTVQLMATGHTQQVTLPVGGLQQGIYRLRVQGGGHAIIHTFLKQ